MTRLGERRWTLDAEGRITRVDLGAEATPRRFEGPLVGAVRFVYDADAAP